MLTLHQSLENADLAVTGTLYSHIGDSYMGLAGLEDPSTAQGARLRATQVSRAEMYIDRARECRCFLSPGMKAWFFADSTPGVKRIESLDGECEQLMKKAIIAKLRGDEKLAEEWAQNHNRIWDQGMSRIMDSDGRA